MIGIRWRLLAVFSLILVAPMILHGQDAAADRAPANAPAVERILAPNLTPLRSSPPITSVWIPPPNLPRPFPVAPQRPFFPQLVRSAGIIFSGTVTSIGNAPSSGGQTPASTAVTFQVEHAMRGTSAGQSLTIHEWAGLWTGGERYRVGEHVLLFLYSPSKLGLTSPVAGAIGKFVVDSQGRVVMNAQQAATLTGDPVLAVKAGGREVVLYADFAQAVQRSRGEK
jgi:hypothetical protein